MPCPRFCWRHCGVGGVAGPVCLRGPAGVAGAVWRTAFWAGGAGRSAVGACRPHGYFHGGQHAALCGDGWLGGAGGPAWAGACAGTCTDAGWGVDARHGRVARRPRCLEGRPALCAGCGDVGGVHAGVSRLRPVAVARGGAGESRVCRGAAARGAGVGRSAAGVRALAGRGSSGIRARGDGRCAGPGGLLGGDCTAGHGPCGTVCGAGAGIYGAGCGVVVGGIA